MKSRRARVGWTLFLLFVGVPVLCIGAALYALLLVAGVILELWRDP